MEYGFYDLAELTAYKTAQLLAKSQDREFYDTESGKGDGLNPFWGWSLLGYFMPMEAFEDFDRPIWNWIQTICMPICLISVWGRTLGCKKNKKPGRREYCYQIRKYFTEKWTTEIPLSIFCRRGSLLPLIFYRLPISQ